MFFDDCKKQNNLYSKTPNNSESIHNPADKNREVIYKKYKSSNIFETVYVNNNQIKSSRENAILNVRFIKYKSLINRKNQVKKKSFQRK